MGETLEPQRARQAGEAGLADAGQRQPTVAGAVQAVERSEAHLVVVELPRAHRVAVGVEVLLGGDEQAGVQMRALDVLPFAGAGTVLEGEEDGDGTEEAVVVVLVAHDPTDGTAPFTCPLVQQTGEPRDERGEALQIGLRTGRPEAREVAVHQVGLEP